MLRNTTFFLFLCSSGCKWSFLSDLFIVHLHSLQKCSLNANKYLLVNLWLNSSERFLMQTTNCTRYILQIHYIILIEVIFQILFYCYVYKCFIRICCKGFFKKQWKNNSPKYSLKVRKKPKTLLPM